MNDALKKLTYVPGVIHRAIFGPSLVKRLVIAQLLVLGATWLVIFYALEIQPPSLNGTFEGDRRFEAWLSIADELKNEPDRLKRVLTHIDKHQRQVGNAEDSTYSRITMTVWQGNTMVYSSPDKPGPMPRGEDGVVVEHMVEGEAWLSGTLSQPESGLAITLTRRRSFSQTLSSLEGSVEFLAALLAVMPILLLPAWVSVLMAVRPIKRLGRQLTQRSPEDLSPLTPTVRDRELRPLLDAINSWLDRLRASQEREKDFIANAAHELRTPLAAIRVHAEGLQQQELTPEAMSLLNGALQATYRATRMTEQMLSILRNEVEAASLAELQSIDLGALLQLQLAAMAPLADAQQIELELSVPQPVWVLGRLELLESVVDNLVGNAIRHGPANSTVWVSAKPVGSMVCLEVEDSGPGIPKEWRERVFERFRSVPGNPSTGAGLGLSIVQSATHAMRGAVSLDVSPTLGGLRVRVDLQRVP